VIAPRVAIRSFASQADYQACVALQYETWGADFRDVVPPSIQLVSQKLGGVAAGAFDGDRLLGFVFGMTGVEDGAIVHWSDMLAVRPEARGSGVARDLKEFQRREVAKVGGRVIYWTYDPLVSRNAHLNINVFGVRVARYVCDMYGSDTGSDLHRGIGTDRLVVAWPVDDAELGKRRAEVRHARNAKEFATAPVVGGAGHPGNAHIGGEPRLRIAIPGDLDALLRNSPDAAVAWRRSTRDAFLAALAAGYTVDGFIGAKSGDHSHYLLSRR
jgi:predicted GNAT superfamily acetyltransferase